MIEHFKKGADIQMRKLDSSNIITKFWDCFLSCMRGHIDSRINEGRYFIIDGDIIKIQFTSCYFRLTKEWFAQYQEAPPTKSTMMDALKKDSAFEKIGKVRLKMGATKESKVCSAYFFDLSKIDVSEEIVISIGLQQNKGILDNEVEEKLPI
jgi:hypothetical protein